MQRVSGVLAGLKMWAKRLKRDVVALWLALAIRGCPGLRRL